jgi:hypothetical protein
MAGELSLSMRQLQAWTTQMTSPDGDFHTSAFRFEAIGFGLVRDACKHILNSLTETAHRSAERSRFALLPRRYLDDVGMTIAERDAQVL